MGLSSIYQRFNQILIRGWEDFWVNVIRRGGENQEKVVTGEKLGYNGQRKGEDRWRRKYLDIAGRLISIGLLSVWWK